MRTLFVSMLLVGGALSACGGNRGKIMADTMQYDAKTQKWSPIIEYKVPDIDEITGIDSSEEPADAKPAGK